MKQFKTTSQDWFNFIAQGLTANALIQYVIKPSEHIDYHLLAKAVMCSIQAEPVLGCIFAEDQPIPVWKPVPVNTGDICRLVETRDCEKETGLFLAKELDVSTRPPIEVCLISNGKSDTVAVKIHHAACDGAGSKYYVKLLAEIYTRLESGNAFVPQTKSTNRDAKKFYETFGINDIKSYFNPEKADLVSTWGFPADKNRPGTQKFSYRLLRYNQSQLQKIQQYAKKHNTTVNTVLIAAYHAALLEVLKPAGIKKEIQFMIDLRNYLPPDSEPTICNLSAILNVDLPVQVSEFTDMVTQTRLALKDTLTHDNLIHGAIACDLSLEPGFAATAGFTRSDWEHIQETGNCTPMISNFGILDSKTICFGKIQVEDWYLVSPAFYAPAFMLGVSTFHNVLTFCASYYSPGTDPDTVKDLFKQVNDLLTTHVFNS